MSTWQGNVLRGTRAAQPAAASVVVGAIYCVTDEGNILERSTGAAWEAFSPVSGATSVTAASVITDNAIVRGDGGARGAQLSLITISDTGALTVPDDVRQTFNPGATVAGLNVGALAGDPSTPINGDLWYDSTANELTARINGASVALGAASAGGTFVQAVNTQTGALATGTTVIPLDDTIPQNTEGDEYMTLAVTPTNAANILQIDAIWCGSSNAPNWLIAALFQDATAGALAAAGTYQNIGTGGNILRFRHTMVAGTTSATTFKLRAGRDASAGTTVTFNGANGARLLGGVMASSLTITEYVP